MYIKKPGNAYKKTSQKQTVQNVPLFVNCKKLFKHEENKQAGQKARVDLLQLNKTADY